MFFISFKNLQITYSISYKSASDVTILLIFIAFMSLIAEVFNDVGLSGFQALKTDV